MDKIWTEIKVHGKREDLDTLSAIMSVLDPGIVTEDLSDIVRDDVYGELIDESILNADRTRVAVSIYISPEGNVGNALNFINSRLDELGIERETELISHREEDWENSWKQYYTPQHFGRLTILPAWYDYEPKPDEVIVRLDPGMAFGTGTHETTRLALRLICELADCDTVMCDVGCGSGILSIAACALGAKRAEAYDLDPTAVRVAKENVEIAGVKNVTCGVSNLFSDVKKPEGGFNFIAANIIADIILRMLPTLPEYLSQDGIAILSGIIAPQEAEVRAAVDAIGFEIIRSEYENDWCAFVVRRKQ